MSSRQKQHNTSVTLCLLRLRACLRLKHQRLPVRQQPAAGAHPSAFSLLSTRTLACPMCSRKRARPSKKPQLLMHRHLLLRRRALGRRSRAHGAGQAVSTLPQNLAPTRQPSKAGMRLIKMTLLHRRLSHCACRWQNRSRDKLNCPHMERCTQIRASQSPPMSRCIPIARTEKLMLISVCLLQRGHAAWEHIAF